MKEVQGNVGEVLSERDERGVKSKVCVDLDLNQIIDRSVGDLSGGELQRFAIAGVAIQNAEIYMFDEPSSYLDVKQRLKAAQVVRSLLRPNRSSLFLILEPKFFASLLVYRNSYSCLCVLNFSAMLLLLSTTLVSWITYRTLFAAYTESLEFMGW